MGRSWKAYENLYFRVDVGTLVRFAGRADVKAKILPILLLHRMGGLERDKKVD